MRYNERPAYMEGLRQSEAYPSFDYVEALVASHQSDWRRMLPLSLRLAFEGAFIVAIVLSLQFNVGRSSLSDKPGLNTMRSATKVRPALNLNQTANDGERQPFGETLRSTERVVPTNYTSNHTNGLEQFAAPIPRAIEPTGPLQPGIHGASLPRRLTGSMPLVQPSLWAVYASGETLLSPSSGISSFGGAVGIQYRVSPSSSILLEVRRTMFTNRPGSEVSYQDTLVTVGGQTYLNTLGTNTAGSLGGPMPVYSFAAGYRFEFAPIGNLTPFIEGSVGGSIHGVVPAERAGVVLFAGSAISVDLAAESIQLIPISARSQASYGLAAGLRYAF